MTKEETLQHLIRHAGVVLIDGLDDALMGFVENQHATPRPLYDLEKCVAIVQHRLGWTFPTAGDVIRDGLTRGWWPGDGVPAFAVLVENAEIPSITMTTTME